MPPRPAKPPARPGRSPRARRAAGRTPGSGRGPAPGPAAVDRPAEADLSDPDRGVRLQRVLSAAGVASRRACEDLIRSGSVRVNGVVVRDLPAFVDPRRDRIVVGGHPLPAAESPVYVALNKPAGVLAASRDEPGVGRRTITDLVEHPSGARLYAVGRLEFDAEGLVLLTNDGRLAHRLTHPRYGLERVYHLSVRGTIDPAQFPRLERAIARAARRFTASAGSVRARVAVAVSESGRAVIEVTVTGPAGVSIPKVFAAEGLPVRKFERVAVGPVRLNRIPRGRWRDLDRDEIRALRAVIRDPATAQDSPA